MHPGAACGPGPERISRSVTGHPRTHNYTVIRTARSLVRLTALTVSAAVIPIGPASAVGTIAHQAPPPSSLCSLGDLNDDPLTLDLLQGACASVRAAAGAIESEAHHFATDPVPDTHRYESCLLGLLPGPCHLYL